MNFLEKDLEDIIFETDNDLLFEHGLFIDGQKKRQVRIGNYGIADLITCSRRECDLHSVRIGNYGIADLITCSRRECDLHSYPSTYLDITVFELKKDILDNNAFFQAIKYARGIQSYLEYRKIENYTINITLIGKELNLHDDFIYIPSLIHSEYIFKQLASFNIYTYSYEFDGIQFEKQYDYVLKNNGWEGVR